MADKNKRNYRILRREQEGVGVPHPSMDAQIGYADLGLVEATGADQACSQYVADEELEGPVTLVAVPERFFAPITFSVEPQPAKLTITREKPRHTRAAAKSKESVPA